MRNRKRPKKEKNPSNPRPRTAGHPISSQGHTQFSTRRDGFFSLKPKVFILLLLYSDHYARIVVAI